MKTAFTPQVADIVKYKEENGDTFTIEIESPGGSFEFMPGQFNMLYLPGYGEVAISISGNPNNKKTITHTVRAVGGVTKAMMKLRSGSQVGIRGPYGNSWPVKEAQNSDVILIAGGVGLAPLRPMIYAMADGADRRAELGLRTGIYYGARAPENIIFAKELKEWAKLPSFDVVVTVDNPTRDWDGETGWIAAHLPERVDNPNTIAMLCGPEGMMRITAHKLTDIGVADENIYISQERNMKCGIGLCGHCQYGEYFVCRDGPVFGYKEIKKLLGVREI